MSLVLEMYNSSKDQYILQLETQARDLCNTHFHNGAWNNITAKDEYLKIMGELQDLRGF